MTPSHQLYQSRKRHMDKVSVVSVGVLKVAKREGTYMTCQHKKKKKKKRCHTNFEYPLHIAYLPDLTRFIKFRW